MTKVKAMEVFYDPDVGMAGVCFEEGKPARTVFVDEHRSIEYGGEDQVIGLEFSHAALGVRLLGLPVDVRALTDAMRLAGITVLDVPRTTGALDLNQQSSSPSATSGSLISL